MENSNLICGPMATISHPGFRILVEKFGGVDEYFTEMINAGSLLHGGPFEKFYIDSTPCPEKLVWQLTGHDQENMVKAACVLCGIPAKGIDINMGCSAPDIYKTGAGISWMIKERDQTMHMVSAVKKVMEKENPAMRLSVKLRLGEDNFTDEGFYSFCDELINQGVQLLTLHPRTKKEKLARPPRYKYCQDLALRMKEKGVPVILNGNVKDVLSYENAVKAAPDACGVMICRMAVQKPWIFAEIKAKTQNSQGTDPSTPKEIIVNREELAYEYIDLVEKYQPVEFWKTRLQRFFTYFSMNFLFGHYAQTQFLNAKDNQDLREKIRDFFEKFPDEKILILK